MTDRDPTATTGLLLDATDSVDTSSWLVPGGEAALAAGLCAAHPGADIRWQPIDLRERDALARTPANLTINAPGAPHPGVEATVIAAPPDRDLSRRWLMEARQALAPGGRIFLAGANAEGIRSQIADARGLFGHPLREEYRSRQRLATFAAETIPDPLPAWASTPGIVPGTWQPFPLDLGDTVLELVTRPGVFAGNRVDAGTRLLLTALPRAVTGRVLDVGCGAGVIGIAAALRGAAAVDLTDVNLLAVETATENARRAAAAGGTTATMRALAGDVYGAIGDARYDLVASNPPFHRGKVIDLSVADRLIAGAPAHLAPGGALLVVANAFLAYGKRMDAVFRHVETVAATRRYHVIRATDPR